MPAFESRTTFLAAKLCLRCRNLWTNRAFCRWVRNFEFCAALGSNWLILMIPSSGKMVSLQTRQILSTKRIRKHFMTANSTWLQTWHILSMKNKNQIKNVTASSNGLQENRNCRVIIRPFHIYGIARAKLAVKNALLISNHVQGMYVQSSCKQYS